MILATLNTNGKGLWSSETRAVDITKMKLTLYPYLRPVDEFGELRVAFSTKTWNTEDHGLIYTDPKFLKELQAFLNSLGLAGKDVDYSEQGMQGEDFVSLEVGSQFITSWAKYFGINVPVNESKDDMEIAVGKIMQSVLTPKKAKKAKKNKKAKKAISH